MLLNIILDKYLYLLTIYNTWVIRNSNYEDYLSGKLGVTPLRYFRSINYHIIILDLEF